MRQPDDSFNLLILSVLAGITLGALFLAIPALIRQFRPKRYTGFWRMIGEIMPVSLARWIRLVLGSLIGLTVVVMLRYGYPRLWETLTQSPLFSLWACLVPLFISGLALVVGLRRWADR